MSHSLTWNGTAFSTYGLIVRLATPAPTLSRRYDSIQTQDRAWAGKGQGAASVFNLPVIIVGTSSSNLLSRVSTIRGLLDQEDECTLAFDMYTDRYWMAKFDSLEGDYTSPTTWEGTLIFTCHDRKAYATAASTQTETLTENISAVLGTISSIAIDPDDDYIYVTAGTTVYKLSSIDLSTVDSYAGYGGLLYSVCAPTGDYIYIAGAITLKVYQLLKSDLTKNAESPSYGAGTTIYAIVDYGNYIYYGGDGGAGEYDVCKLLKSDMTTIVRSPDTGAEIYALCCNSIHVLAGGQFVGGGNFVRRYLITDMSYVDITADDYTDAIRSLAIDSTYLYICGDSDTVMQVTLATMATKDISADLGTELLAITVDSEYVYVAGKDNVLYKLDIADIDIQVAKSEDYGGDIKAVAIDATNNRLYLGGAATRTVWKLDTRHLITQATSTDSYTSTGWRMLVDDDFLYFTETTNDKVYKYRKSDLVLIAQSASYGGNINAMCQSNDGLYLFIGGSTTQTVRKLLKDDLSLIQESADYGGQITCICCDDDHVFVAGATIQKVFRLNIDTLVKEAQTADYGGVPYCITESGTSVYMGGDTTHKVYKYTKATMAKAAESADLTGMAYCMTNDGTSLYVGSAEVSTIWKITMATMATAASVALTVDYAYWIEVDTTYLYVGTEADRLEKRLVSDLSLVCYTTDYCGTVTSSINCLAIDSSSIYTYDGYLYKIDNRCLWKRSDHEITITSSGTAKCGLDFASTASQANYWQQAYGNQTTGDEFDWEGTQASGEELEVDSELQYCTLEGDSAMSGVSGEFLTLSPGANVLYLENVTGVVVFDWTDRFA